MASLMGRISWSLGFKKYQDYNEFIKEVTERTHQIFGEKTSWDPDKVIDSDNQIVVLFQAFWKDEDDELTITIDSPNGKGISMGQALFEINNQGYWMFENVDKHFFEGISYSEDYEGVPHYFLHMGS
jgi:hypothetical protein